MRRSDFMRISTEVWGQPTRLIRCLTCEPTEMTITVQHHIDTHAPATCARCMGDLWIDNDGVLVLWGHPGGGVGYV